MTANPRFPPSLKISTSSTERFPATADLTVTVVGHEARVTVTPAGGFTETFDGCRVNGNLVSRAFDEGGEKKFFLLSLCEVAGRRPFVCGALFEPGGRRGDTATGAWVAEEGGDDQP